MTPAGTKFRHARLTSVLMSGVVALVLNVLPCSVTAALAADEEKLDHLELSIFFTPRFVAVTNLESSASSAICSALGDALIAGKGPWGFGLFSKVVECTGADSTKTTNSNRKLDSSKSKVWELRVDLNEANQAVVSLLRFAGDLGEKREALVTIPTSKFLPKILGNRKMGRLIGALILDHAPFRSKLTSTLIMNSPLPTPKEDVSEQEPFKLPSYPDQLLPVAITFLPQSGTFKVSSRKSSLLELLKEGNIWVVTRKRGDMSKELFVRISNATDFLGKEEQRKAELNQNASKIFGRNARREAKSPRPFLGRVEIVAEARGGTSFSGTEDNSVGSDMNILFTEDMFTNIWLDASFLRGSYEYEIDSKSAVLGKSTKARSNRTLLIGSLGTGFRWSSGSDHTLFFYPKLEFGTMEWKSESLTQKLPSEFRGIDFAATVSPGIGFFLGYQTPEAWPIGYQLRIGGTGLNLETFKTFLVDGSISIPSPISLGSRRGEIFAFGQFQTTSLFAPKTSADVFKNFSLQANDIVVGGGYRWLWL
jgi:hypothetical protein